MKNPAANFKNAFSGSSEATPYGATNALMKVIYSYVGYANAFNVVNEVKNPTKTLRWSAPLSLTLVAVLYILVNVAYFAAATKEEILASKVTAASLFFEKVFGNGGASRALNFLICLSAFGNLLAVLVGQSRVLRECGRYEFIVFLFYVLRSLLEMLTWIKKKRQGVLPFTRFWTSTWPFATPLGPYLVKWGLTIILIIAPPFGDAFNFGLFFKKATILVALLTIYRIHIVVDLALYPGNFFLFLLSVGLLVTRWRRNKLGLGPSGYKAWDSAVGFSIISNIYMLVMPWYPPSTGPDGGDVSFWYATYCATGLAM